MKTYLSILLLCATANAADLRFSYDKFSDKTVIDLKKEISIVNSAGIILKLTAGQVCSGQVNTPCNGPVFLTFKKEFGETCDALRDGEKTLELLVDGERVQVAEPYKWTYYLGRDFSGGLQCTEWANVQISWDLYNKVVAAKEVEGRLNGVWKFKIQAKGIERLKILASNTY